jgi:hypothetical protein
MSARPERRSDAACQDQHKPVPAEDAGPSVREIPQKLSSPDASLRNLARALLALAYQVLEEESE